MGSNELCKKQPCVSIRWHIILKIVLNLGKFFYSLVQRIHIKVRIQLNIVAPYYLPSSSCRIMGSLMVNEAHRVRNLQVRHAKEHRCAALQNLRLGEQPRQHSRLHLLPQTAGPCCITGMAHLLILFLNAPSAEEAWPPPPAYHCEVSEHCVRKRT